MAHGLTAEAAQARGLINDGVVLRLLQRHRPSKPFLIVFQVYTPRFVSLVRLHGFLAAEPAKTDGPTPKVTSRHCELHLDVRFHQAPIP